MKTLLLTLFLIITVAYANKARFDNYRVYSLNIINENQLNILRSIENGPNDGFTFWTSIMLGRSTDIMVAPHKFGDFAELMQSLQIDYELKVENVQTLIDNERPKVKPRAFGWTDYHTLEEIYEWLDEKIGQYPDILTNQFIGTSFQGREIRAVRLSYKAGNPAVFLESNIHAREWITSATATWWINELLTSTEPEIRDLAENIDWYILPVLNVDGFSYTHTVNRLWRKTRYPHAHICYGTDPNRNYDFHWMANGGASDNPCSETFAGPHVWSEPETVAHAAFVRSIADNLKLYFTFHSYGQYILFPYGHDYIHSAHHESLTSIANRTVEGFARRFGTDYVAGTAAEALYIASGTSIDWVYESLGVPIDYTIELRDRRGGSYGFVLPANQIIDNCLETKDALIEMVAETRRLGYM